ncbi:hypothetical protein KNT87_gp091 [Erwinia phage Cronus]|uniref:Uncharacterized protein n=1 Tax=Erwinia phage Cronus TaxID=2163633 RepID=A0A2S1GMD2_9CAUD|nr:hypothetical protein KNT87_gp091 [Erwinia phage Cronus]AWD90530.1 hypothetical protein [Erwinia phage Cronus]
MSNTYDVGDLLVTQEYDGERIEVCIFKGKTGSLFLCVTTCLASQQERFVKNHESLPYCTRVIREKDFPSFITNRISKYA